MYRPPCTRWSVAAEQNTAPIGAALAPYFERPRRVLEIGSGTGQHAWAFSQRFADCHWQPSDHPAALADLQVGLDRPLPANLAAPIALDAAAPQWPALQADMVYSANTLHIMSWKAARQLFTHLGRLLPAGGEALFYGPFRFADRPFADSNAEFDRYLRGRDPHSGLRDAEALIERADSVGLDCSDIIEMPVNNHILVFTRRDETR